MQQINASNHQNALLLDLEVIRISYYRARYYDPTAGRFLSEDPIRFRGRSANVSASLKGIHFRRFEGGPDRAAASSEHTRAPAAA
jgi:hypothetical protein